MSKYYGYKRTKKGYWYKIPHIFKDEEIYRKSPIIIYTIKYSDTITYQLRQNTYGGKTMLMFRRFEK